MNLLVWCCALLTAAAGDGQSAPALFQSRSIYDVQSTLLLNELAGKDRDVGYRLSGTLTLEPVAFDPDQHRMLLKFRLQNVELNLRGAHRNSEYSRHGSLWDSHPDSTFYVLRDKNNILTAYLDPSDLPDMLNYKRALISLFQFQLADGEYKESDISGECDVLYETLSTTVFRKFKRRCAYESGGVRARRISRYTLNAAQDAIGAIHAEELVWIGVGEGEGEEVVGVKARSWHTLTLRSDLQAKAARGGEALEAALKALPAALADTPLLLPLPDKDEDDAESLESALEAYGEALGGWEAGEGGTGEQARALWPLLRAVAAAKEGELRDILHRAEMLPRLRGLCRLLGLAGSQSAWRAARSLLAPAHADALEGLTHHYLEGFALAPQPQEETAVEILSLGEEAKLPSIAESALLAGAAAIARCGDRVQREARDRLAKGLARRPERAGARAVRLRAIGNLRRADSVALLLGAAERGERGDREAALGALRSAPSGALDLAQLERIETLAGNASLPLATRALALELVVERLCSTLKGDMVPLAVVRLARRFGRERGGKAHELRRALWQRLEALGERPAVRALHRVMPPDLASWDARASAGTTSVLRRELNWQGGGWRAALHSAQLASNGLLLRGRVALQAHSQANEGDGEELLAVEVWTRGLEAIAGGGSEGEEEDKDEEEEGGPAAGLQLGVLGASSLAVTLFQSQAELLGHIWSGTGSAPTPALRALAPLSAERRRVPLQAGATVALATHASVSLALDAHAAVSLWQRSARARLALRVAAHGEAEARVSTGWSALNASAAESGEARLRIAPDLDFYDKVALCVRAELQPHATTRRVRLEAVGGARKLRVTRGRDAERSRAGRSLALGRSNDVACRSHSASDPEDDE